MARHTLHILVFVICACLSVPSSAQGPPPAPCPITRYAGVGLKVFHLRETGHQIVLYFCSRQRELRGLGYRVCENGEWSDPGLKPRCENPNDCPVFAPASNGAYNNTGPYRYNDALKLVCDPGYTLLKPRVAKCTVTGWSTTALGSCSKTCPSPQTGGGLEFSASDREVVPGSFNVDTTIEFQCNGPGLKVIGPRKASCLLNGSWSQKQPYCKARTCRIVVLLAKSSIYSSAGLQISPNQTKYKYGETVRISCESENSGPDRRYLYPSGSTRFKCNADPGRNGNYLAWTGLGDLKVSKARKVECRRYCLRGAIRIDASTASKFTFSSAKGLFRTGEKLRVGCEGGRELYAWNTELNSDSVSFTCTPQSTWENNANLDLATPVACRATSCQRPANLHALLDVDEGGGGPRAVFGNNFSVHFSCGRHRLMGSATSTCVQRGLEMVWENEWPTCQWLRLECPDLPVVANGSFVSSETMPYRTNTYVGLQCERCFKPNNKVLTQCREQANGTTAWIPDTSRTRCIRRTCAQLQHDENVLASHTGAVNMTDCGATVRFSCHAGFSLLGVSEVECLPTGEWSDCAPRCVQTTCQNHGGIDSIRRVCKGHSVCHPSSGLCECAPPGRCPTCRVKKPVCSLFAVTYSSLCHLRAADCVDQFSREPVSSGQCPRAGICNQAKPSAPEGSGCFAQYSRWFYNAETGACESYLHGSCFVGDNSFLNKVACLERCFRASEPCEQTPSQAGPCFRFSETRYSYDKLRSSCVAFTYGGCGGNENNFPDMARCERICKRNADGQLPPKSPCSGKACRKTEMHEACPVNSPNVYAIAARVVTDHPAQAPPNTTLFSAIPQAVLHKPEGMEITTSFVYHPMVRVDGGDKQCGCPDLYGNTFVFVGQAQTDDQGLVYFIVDENTFVEQYSTLDVRALRERLYNACPHLRYEAQRG